MPTKLAVSTLITPGCSPEVAAAAIRQAGYEGIEWRISEEGPIRPGHLRADIRAAVAAGRSEGLISIGVASYQRLLDPEALQRELEVAVELGTPRLRPYWPEYDASVSAKDIFHSTRDAMERLAPHVDKAGVTVLIKTHRRSVVPTASAAKRLVEVFSSSLYSVLYDPGNTVTSGLEDPCYAVEILGRHLSHIHVKNSGWIRDRGTWSWGWMALDEGMVDWPAFLRHLKHMGYSGWLSNENFLLVPVDQRPAIGEIFTGFPSFLKGIDLELTERLRLDRRYLEAHLGDVPAAGSE